MINLYSTLTVLVVSFLLGMTFGMFVIAAGIRKFIKHGLMDMYVKGRRVDTFELF